MAAGIRYKQSSKGIEALLKSSGTASMLRGKAGPVLSAAQANAPVDTGAYRDSLRLEDDTTDRAVVRVVSDVAYAVLVESQTGNLARALGSA